MKNNLKFKKIFLYSLIFMFLVLFSLTTVKALTAAEYNKTLIDAKTNYENAIKQAKDSYSEKMNAIIQKKANDLQTTSDLYKQKKITQNEYNAKIAEINDNFNKNFSNSWTALYKDIDNAGKEYMDKIPEPAPASDVTKYKCSGSSCVRDDISGIYNNSNCNNACSATTTNAKYKCSSSVCVRDDASGTYTSSSCNNACSTTTSIPSDVITLIPQVYATRYGPVCGLFGNVSGTRQEGGQFYGPVNPPATGATGGTVTLKAGETKYYKINMTKWIEWQRLYYAMYKSVFIERSYGICRSTASYYSSVASSPACNDDGSINQTWCDANMQDCFRYAMLDTCHYATNPGYGGQGDCDANKASYIATADAELKAKEALYKSGNYKTKFSPLTFGCDPYVSNWGCEAKKDGSTTWFTLQFAFGYDQLPTYETINKFIKVFSYYYSGNIPNFSASNPILAMEGEIQLASSPSGYSGGYSNGEYPVVMAFSDGQVYDAKEIYIMIHNAGSETRNIGIEGSCPDGVPK